MYPCRTLTKRLMPESKDSCLSRMALHWTNCWISIGSGSRAGIGVLSINTGMIGILRVSAPGSGRPDAGTVVRVGRPVTKGRQPSMRGSDRGPGIDLPVVGPLTDASSLRHWMLRSWSTASSNP